MINLKEEYSKLCTTKSDINEHLPTLTKYGKEVYHITEFGVRSGRSTIAFLYSDPIILVSYDLKPTKFKYKGFESPNFTLVKGNTLKIEIDETDLLFIDTDHTYTQLSGELKLHGNKVRKYIIFHDTEIFGKVGMDKKQPGLLQAIYEFMGDTWKIKERFKNNNGLVIIERQQ